METRKHTRPDGIWLFDYTSLSEMDDCAELMVWLSQRDLQIILQGLKDIDRFRSRVFTSVNGDVYTLVSKEQFETYQGWVSDMFVNLGGYQMCNDLLQGILDAINNFAISQSGCGGCSGGSRGSGTMPEPFDPFSDDGHTSYPPSFPSQEVYDAHKCNAAADLLQHLMSDLTGISGLELSISSPTGVAGILIAVLLTPVPFDDLVALAGLLIYTGINYSFLASTRALIFDDYSNMLCILYQADTAEQAQNDLRDRIATLVNAQSWLSAEKEFVFNCVDTLTESDVFNRLFNDLPTENSDADCTDCGSVPADCLSVTDGFIDGIEAAEGYNGVMHIHTGGNAGDFGCTGGNTLIRIECPCETTLHIVSTGSYVTTGACDTFYVYDVMDTTVQYNSNTWSDTTIPAGGGLYIFTDDESSWDIYFLNS